MGYVLTSAKREREGWLLERGGGWGALLCNSEEIPSHSPSKQYFSLEAKVAKAHIHARQNRYKWFSVYRKSRLVTGETIILFPLLKK